MRHVKFSGVKHAVFVLCNRHNTEKVVYFLLLDRKLRNPSNEDEAEIRSKSLDAGAPTGS